MSTGSNQALTELCSASSPANIEDVLALMRNIDSALAADDGLRWFNLLYMTVTASVLDKPPAGGWADPDWLTRLDVVFAGFYFSALARIVSDSASVPSAWRALLEARRRPGVDRIQFALAGMNAHINHDLPLALIATNRERNIVPAVSSPEHSDFERVNDLLDAVLPEALHFLATGIIGQIAQDTGKIGRLLAMWNVRVARDLAWDNASLLASLDETSRQRSLDSLDKLTGVASRALLLPIINDC